MANQSIYKAFERMWQHVLAKIGGKADVGHTHDGLYYTEVEMDATLNNINTNITSLENNKADKDHNHDDYDLKGSANEALESAKGYTDEKLSSIPAVDAYTKTEIDSKLSTVNTSISDITSGNIVVKKSEESEHAMGADKATSAISADTAATATKANQDGNGNEIVSTYETKSDASAKLTEAKKYTDTAVDGKADKNHNHDDKYDAKGASTESLSQSKEYTDEKIALLLNNSSEAVDSIYELRDAMSDNADAIEALKTIASGKADASHNHTVSNITDLTATATELNYMDGVTSNVQTQLDTKANTSNLTSHTSNKSNPHGVTLAQLGVNATATELNYVDGVTSSIQNQLNSKMGDFSIELYNGTGGNPKPVRFASFNYSTCVSEEGIAAKISLVSGHGNGTAYSFLEDAIIRVNYLGSVEVDNFKYYGQSCGNYDGESRQYGDIFWLIDETNKIVDFYVLMGQYARVQQTPWKRLTYSSKGTVTQYTSCTVYSSGTKVWANNSEIATKNDIPEGQDLSKYATKATTLSGYGITDAYTNVEVDEIVETLNNSIGSKATKSTTLSGYGITDAYTKTQVDNALAGKQAAGSYATSSHTHDDRYYTETEINTKVDALNSAINGKADSGHTHNYAGSSSAGGAATSANKVNKSLTVKLNSGTTEGTNLFTFDGSAAKSVNITPSSIGAAASSHTHDDRYYTESEIDTKVSSLQSSINGKANSSHTHDDRYYTESEIDGKVSALNTAINGKAASSHGNHVPATQTASNKVFLRNDNTWQTITPANIGAQPAGSYAASSHTHDDRYYTETEVDTKLSSKANTSDLTSHTGNKSNPHGVTATQVGALPISGGTITSNLGVNGKLVQGNPNADTSVSSMNRFEDDLFIVGSGSAPNNPRVAGFYLGKSETDENRHMDIVSGADYSYIDFNKASRESDFDARILVNVTNGYTIFQWGTSDELTQKVLNVNGAIQQHGVPVSLSGHTHADYVTSATVQAMIDAAIANAIGGSY